MNNEVVVIYTTKSRKDLRKLDKSISKKIVLKITELAHRKSPLTAAKALSGNYNGKFRYRIGDYRAIFIVDNKGRVVLLTILDIKHRKDIYRK